MRYVFFVAVLSICLSFALGNNGSAVEIKQASFLSERELNVVHKETFEINNKGSQDEEDSTPKITPSVQPQEPQILPTANLQQEEESTVTLEQLQSNLHIGMTRDQLRSFLDTPNEIGFSAMDGKEVWRYDFVHTEGYVFEETPEFKEMAIVDTVDMDGLKNNHLDMQLFINWSEDTVSHIVVYYNNDESVYEYRVFENGEVRDRKVS